METLRGYYLGSFADAVSYLFAISNCESKPCTVSCKTCGVRARKYCDTEQFRGHQRTRHV